MQVVGRYTDIQELTYENVHEFIDRILVHELDTETDTRKVEIFYSFVVQIDSGEEPTQKTYHFISTSADGSTMRISTFFISSKVIGVQPPSALRENPDKT